VEVEGISWVELYHIVMYFEIATATVNVISSGSLNVRRNRKNSAKAFFSKEV
jgi:hypothetical protein